LVQGADGTVARRSASPMMTGSPARAGDQPAGTGRRRFRLQRQGIAGSATTAGQGHGRRRPEARFFILFPL
jgi:hypothetical protein